MGVRQRMLQQIREKLEESKEKSARRAADLAVSVSEKANEEDVFEVARGITNVVQFIPSLALFAVNLTVDPRVPVGDKIKIGLLTAFLISPADILLLELIGPMALMDDIVIVGYLIFSIASLIGNLDDDVARENWVGNEEHLKQFMDAARTISGLPGPASGKIIPDVI